MTADEIATLNALPTAAIFTVLVAWLVRFFIKKVAK